MSRIVTEPDLATWPSADMSLPSRLAQQFARAELVGQFVLSPSLDSIPAGWSSHTRRTWALGAHPALPVLAMRASDGAEVGWLVGFPIDAQGRWLSGEVALPVPAAASAADFEAFIYTMGGRFVAIWISPVMERVYLDSAGLLSAVYAPAHEMVASTPSLVPYSRGCDDDVELLRSTGMPSSTAVLGFGLTSRLGVERILPNHYLDLREWKTRRHWPHEPFDGKADPAESIDTVARVVERQIAAVAGEGQAYISLTAGYDSRTLLACARGHLDHLQFITLALPDRTGRIDVEVAQVIARAHGLHHRVIPYLEASPEELGSWLWRTGGSVSEPRGWRATRTYGQLDASLPEIIGTAGETARAAYWHDCGDGRHDLTPEIVLAALMLPKTPRLVERARLWMADVPATRPMHLIDAIYIEQRLGCWAGVLSYGDAGSVRCRFKPFVHREALTAMLRLSDAYKLTRRFQADVIATRWPELMKVPFNRRIGTRHYLDRARRRVWLIRRALDRGRGGA
jgi:hypothetical protein